MSVCQSLGCSATFSVASRYSLEWQDDILRRRKDLGENGRGLIEVLSWNLAG
jgi:hypothetical protein